MLIPWPDFALLVVIVALASAIVGAIIGVTVERRFIRPFKEALLELAVVQARLATYEKEDKDKYPPSFALAN